MNLPATPNRTLSVPETVVARQVGDEMVLLDLDSGTYFTLNGTGAFIWQQVSSAVPASDIPALIAEHWEVTAEQAALDVEEFVAEMVELGLLASA